MMQGHKVCPYSSHLFLVHALFQAHTTSNKLGAGGMIEKFIYDIKQDKTEGEPWNSGKEVQVLDTTPCRNAGKDCVHKSQSGQTLS
jgi:hypothetical protein